MSNYKRCDCGEEYLEKDSHERTSTRHKEWLEGNIEVPVPVQPLSGSFPAEGPRPKLIVGETLICGKCKGTGEGTQMKDGKCLRCNGWGIVPNQGPVARPKGKI